MLRAILERLKPDVVNIHFPDWQVNLIPLIRSVSTSRVVVSLHGDEVMRAVRGDDHQRDRLVAALVQADWVTACSGWLLKQLCPFAPEVAGKATVTWNGIDAERFDGVEGMPYERPYVLGFGRFVAKKGFDLLIDAFARIDGGADIDLVLVGSGPESDRLKQQAVDRGLSERVVFPGRAFEHEMSRWIQGAQLAVVPSYEEPFGIAALEVVAAGVPLVATRVGGMAEVMGGYASEFRSVVLSEPDSESLAVAMRGTLASERNERSVRELTKRVRAEYSSGLRHGGIRGCPGRVDEPGKSMIEKLIILSGGAVVMALLLSGKTKLLCWVWLGLHGRRTEASGSSTRILFMKSTGSSKSSRSQCFFFFSRFSTVRYVGKTLNRWDLSSMALLGFGVIVAFGQPNNHSMSSWRGWCLYFRSI